MHASALNLRLIFSPLKPSFPLSKTSVCTTSSFHHLTIRCSSSPKPPRLRPFSLKHQRRNVSSIQLDTRTKDKEKRLPFMEENGKLGTSGSQSFDFNRKRAEGLDGNNKPKKNLKLKVRKLNPTNTISYVQILGTGMDTQDTSPSVLLFFDKQRFIFNAGEGLQRFCTEHKIKLSKIDHIFLSRVCSETAGGLPGLLLTLAGIGEEGISVNIWGSSDLKYMVDAMKLFVPHAAMVHTRSFGSISDGLLNTNGDTSPIVLVEDEVVKISALLLKPRNSEGSATKPGEISVVYLCELPDIVGKFDPEKAKALGLKPGPKFGQLQSGRSVFSDRDNVLVHPGDVMGPSVPGPIVLLVDCPTELHVEDLLSKQYLNKYYSDFSNDQREDVKLVNCIIHLSPASLIRNPDYQNWMKKFGSAQHIMAGHGMKSPEVPIMKASARIGTMLNYLCPQFFPSPGFSLLKKFRNSNFYSKSLNEGKESDFCEGISAENLLKFILRPHVQLGLDKSNIPSAFSPSEVIANFCKETPEISEAAQSIGELWNEVGETQGAVVVSMNGESIVEEPWLKPCTLPVCLDRVRRDDLEIVMLGTGSSQPSKYRNVSSIFINLFSKGGVFLDCGEGTLGQLKRRYGVEGADDIVRNLKCVWISHIHADHHSGLARILALRRELLKDVPHEPIIVIGPRQLNRYLDAYQRLEDLDMQFIDCRSTCTEAWETLDIGEKLRETTTTTENSSLFSEGDRMQSIWQKPGSHIGESKALHALTTLKRVLNDAGLDTLISFPVVHCPQAFGVALKASARTNCAEKIIPGWKIVYSGDTRPCQELIEASRGATVLIHEATFEDALMDEALARNHSTTKEAIEVGDAAGAYRIILTHFSQRYPKVPVFDNTHIHKTCVAFDMMSVNLADLPVLPRVFPYLKKLFRNDIVADECDETDIATLLS